MNRLYIPTAVTVVLLAITTWQEALFSDRFATTNVTALDFGKRFEEVPRELGDWKGVDKAVNSDVLTAAGAVSHVNRTYTNQKTNEVVDLWLIVGHSREICRHTPDICYPSQGFSPVGSPLKQVIDVPDGTQAEFKTAKFRSESERGLSIERVFWAWNGNDAKHTSWEAPDYQKQHFGNNKALYKLYFKNQVTTSDEGDLMQSPAIKFARVMLPKVDEALFPERLGKGPGSESVGEPTNEQAASE